MPGNKFRTKKSFWDLVPGINYIIRGCFIFAILLFRTKIKQPRQI